MSKVEAAFAAYWRQSINLPDEPEFPEIDDLAKDAFYAAFLAGWNAHKQSRGNDG